MGRNMALIATAAMIATAGLAACDRQTATTSSGGVSLDGGKYCTPFASAVATNTSGGIGPAPTSDPAAAFDDCVHRWGYVLAPSRDPADVVAQAAVEACSSILASWSQQMGQGPEDARYSRREAPSQPDPAAQQMHAAAGRALFYVVQARAGGCAAPPANTLYAPPAPAAGAAPSG